jgi:hypothetical protein
VRPDEIVKGALAFEKLEQRTTTGTKEEGTQEAAGHGAKVIDLPVETNGGAWTRTTDLGIMRPSLYHLSYAAAGLPSRSDAV